MSSITTKLVAGIATTGALGGGAYGVYTLTNASDSVENYLTSKKFIITKQEATTDWDKALKTYKLEKTKELEIDSKSEITANDIKDWCRKNLTKSIKSVEDILFKKASKWCVKYTTIKEQIGTGIKPVKTAEVLNGEYSRFSGELKESIGKVKLSESESRTHADGAKTAKWCTENLDRSYSKDTEFFFANTKQHCFTA